MTGDGLLVTPGGDGLLIVDKPAGWTSHDVVARIRRLAGTRRVGHSGTLDPMATGVLVLGIGKGTRLLTFLVGADKAYEATIRLGQVTSTDDADGVVVESVGAACLDPAEVLRAVTSLVGPGEQVPSSVSAVKVNGERAYAKARRGENPELAARPVVVHRFDVLGQVPVTASRPDAAAVPVLDLQVHVEVSSGTYVRALARDLGAALGVGGHLTRLRRTRVGRFDLAGAHDLQALQRYAQAGLPLLDLADAAREQFPVRELSAPEALALSHGRTIRSPLAPRVEPVAGIGPDGRLVAMLDETAAEARSLVVFAPAGS